MRPFQIVVFTYSGPELVYSGDEIDFKDTELPVDTLLNMKINCRPLD